MIASDWFFRQLRKNYTAKYNSPHNDHGNKYHSINTIKSTEEKENKSIHLHLSRCLNDVERTTHQVPILTEDRFNEVYDSDGKPGPFCDMEDLEYTQEFDEYALPDFLSPGDGKISDYEGNESVSEGGDKSNNYLSVFCC